MSSMQLEWLKSELKQLSYDYSRFSGTVSIPKIISLGFISFLPRNLDWRHHSIKDQGLTYKLQGLN